MKKEKDSISMVDISRMAGVSVATVSRVINQNGRFSQETQKKVEDIIKKYNYKPNMAAKGLKTKRSNFIGVVVPDITNEFFARIILEIQNSLRQEGYLALVCNTNEDAEIEEEYLSMLGAAQMAGLVFISGNTRIADKSLSALPAIYIDRQPDTFDNSNKLIIESDNYGGARLAVQRLYDAGCRKIAYMQAAKSISTHRRRHEGWRDQLNLLGLEADSDLCYQVEEVSFSASRKKMLEILSGGCPFDSIFCATDWLALGALDALGKKNIPVPEQVKVIGFDDISPAALSTPPLTTVHQQVDVMGRTAAKEILRLIDGETITASRIEIAVSLAERKTV